MEAFNREGKLLAITNMPNFGFGNKLIYYFNLRQESAKRNEDFLCSYWDGYQYFEGDLLRQNSFNNIESFPMCLGEKFFSYNNLSSRDVFCLKDKPKIINKSCAIHFRGTDFHQWNPESILGTDYYIDSIIQIIVEEVEEFYLFGDDRNLKSYKDVVKFLKQKEIKFIDYTLSYSNRDKYINDFSIISECDYIISSPSTFCISAGFIGKDKKIIHSSKWIQTRIEQNDKFWIDLDNGGNFNYKLWKKI